MENIQNETYELFFLQYIFLGLVGILFFIFPITSINYFTKLSGSLIVISGIFKLINSFSIEKKIANNFILSALDILFGVLLIFTKINIIENLLIFYGIWAVIRSIILLFGEIIYKNVRLNFKTIYIISLIIIGCLIINYSRINILLVSIIIGIYFMINAICGVFVNLK